MDIVGKIGWHQIVEDYIIHKMKKINFKQCLMYSKQVFGRLVWNGKKIEKKKTDGKCDNPDTH